MSIIIDTSLFITGISFTSNDDCIFIISSRIVISVIIYTSRIFSFFIVNIIIIFISTSIFNDLLYSSTIDGDRFHRVFDNFHLIGCCHTQNSHCYIISISHSPCICKRLIRVYTWVIRFAIIVDIAFFITGVNFSVNRYRIAFPCSRSSIPKVLPAIVFFHIPIRIFRDFHDFPIINCDGFHWIFHNGHLEVNIISHDGHRHIVGST